MWIGLEDERGQLGLRTLEFEVLAGKQGKLACWLLTMYRVGKIGRTDWWETCGAVRSVRRWTKEHGGDLAAWPAGPD